MRQSSRMSEQELIEMNQKERDRLKVLHEAKKRQITQKEAAEQMGELVQWDTSEHDWLEGRGEKLYLSESCGNARRGSGLHHPGWHSALSDRPQICRGRAARSSRASREAARWHHGRSLPAAIPGRKRLPTEAAAAASTSPPPNAQNPHRRPAARLDERLRFTIQ